MPYRSLHHCSVPFKGIKLLECRKSGHNISVMRCWQWLSALPKYYFVEYSIPMIQTNHGFVSQIGTEKWGKRESSRKITNKPERDGNLIDLFYTRPGKRHNCPFSVQQLWRQLSSYGQKCIPSTATTWSQRHIANYYYDVTTLMVYGWCACVCVLIPWK